MVRSDHAGRLNRDERGEYLGNFGPTDNIVVIYKDGSYELTNFDMTNHYEPHEVLLVKKFDSKLPITAIYFDGGQKQHFIKRFNIETSSLDKKFLFISDAKNSKLILASTDIRPRLEIVYPKTAQKEQTAEEYVVEEMVDIRGWRAQGNRSPTTSSRKSAGSNHFRCLWKNRPQWKRQMICPKTKAVTKGLTDNPANALAENTVNPLEERKRSRIENPQEDAGGNTKDENQA